MADLQLRARGSANRSATKADRSVIETVGDDIKRILLASRSPTIDAAI
jgi:hypothetical protein